MTLWQISTIYFNHRKFSDTGKNRMSIVAKMEKLQWVLQKMIRKIHTGTNELNFYLLYLCISGPCLRTMDRYEPIYGVMEIRMKIVWPHSVQSCFWLMPHGLSFLISKNKIIWFQTVQRMMTSVKAQETAKLYKNYSKKYILQ